MEDIDGTPGNVLTLIQELERAQGKAAKRETLKSLAACHADEFSKEILETIGRYLADPAPSVRARTAALLGHCRSRAHLDALIRLTLESDEDVAFAAALALGQIGEAAASNAVAAVVARFEKNLESVQTKKARQQLITPTIYPGDAARTIATFSLRDRLGHDKADARAHNRLSDAQAKVQAVRDALVKCSKSQA